MSRIIGTVLTELNDNNKGIFTVMTSNDISQLPPELTRIGRIDAIWYFTYPNEEERLEIIKIYFNKFYKNNVSEDVIKYTITPQYKKRINNYFKRYGYAFNDYAIPNIYSRHDFNFLKCSVCYLLSENIPREHQEEIKQIFESGITLWHLENNVTPLDYSVSNNPV